MSSLLGPALKRFWLLCQRRWLSFMVLALLFSLPLSWLSFAVDSAFGEDSALSKAVSRILQLIVIPLYEVIAYHLAFSAFTNRRYPLTENLSMSLIHWWPMIVTYFWLNLVLVMGLAAAVFLAVWHLAWLVLSVPLGIGVIYCLLRWSLAPTSVVAEDLQGTAACQRSWTLSRAKFQQVQMLVMQLLATIPTFMVAALPIAYAIYMVILDLEDDLDSWPFSLCIFLTTFSGLLFLAMARAALYQTLLELESASQFADHDADPPATLLAPS